MYDFFRNRKSTLYRRDEWEIKKQKKETLRSNFSLFPIVFYLSNYFLC